MRTGTASSVALEDFIQAVQSQLDTAQARMALKAENDRLALTFAIRDITMDLKAHVEMQDGQVHIKPAGSGDTEASVLHLVFTAITKPMIEENAVMLGEMPGDGRADLLYLAGPRVAAGHASLPPEDGGLSFGVLRHGV